jgi:hypothetical protein
LRELVEGRDLPRRQRRRDRARPMRDQELDPLGVVGGIQCNGKAFGRRSVISDKHGIVVPLFVQPGEVDHPFTRYPALDQVNGDAFLLGADHTDDFRWHGCSSGSQFLGLNETRNNSGMQVFRSQ